MMDYFAEITALASLSVVAVHQILKLNIIPVYFANKFPVLTNILLSIVASVIVSWQTAVSLNDWKQWVAYTGMVSIISAITYNMTIRNSDTIQRLSGKDV